MKIARHIKRHRYRTIAINKIENIPAHQWNKIFPKVPEGYYFLKTLDEAKFDQFKFYYILVYERNELVGCAPCFLVNYSLDTSLNGPMRRVTNLITKAFPKILSLKALVCGIPMGQGYVGISGFSTAIMLAIERRMESLARKLGASITAFKDFDNDYDKYFLELAKKGYLKIDSLPMTRMNLDFTDFEDFLKNLGSSTRYDYRKKLKKSAHIDIEFSHSNTLDEKTLDEVYDLYLQAVEIHDMNFEILPKKFFELISQNMPQETKFFLWRIHGKLVAFCFALILDDLILDYYLGFDFTLSQQYHLYFIKFKDMLEWCLKHGIKTYDMGNTGYGGKRRLRFKFIPVYLYVKSRHKALQPILRVLATLLKFENFDPVLKEWKKSQK